MARRSYSGASAAKAAEVEAPVSEEIVENVDVMDSVSGEKVYDDPASTEDNSVNVMDLEKDEPKLSFEEELEQSRRPGAVYPSEKPEQPDSASQNEPAKEEVKEENPYSELADKFNLSLGEMEVVAEYLKFVENKNDRMKGYQTFMLAGVVVAIFSFIAEILLIAGKLPAAFRSWKVGLILGAVIAISVLVVVFSIKKFMAYSKMEAFKEIQYVIPMILVERKKDEQTGKERWSIRGEGSNDIFWFDWNYSYSTKIDVNGQMHKIKVNTKLKPGMTGYVVGYTNRFNQPKEDFVVFA